MWCKRIYHNFAKKGKARGTIENYTKDSGSVYMRSNNWFNVKWNESKVIIFEGHGVYNSELLSWLVTGESFLGFKDFSKYKDDIKNNNIELTSFSKILAYWHVDIWTISVSELALRIQRYKFCTSIFCIELPVHMGMFVVTFLLPRITLLSDVL